MTKELDLAGGLSDLHHIHTADYDQARAIYDQHVAWRSAPALIRQMRAVVARKRRELDGPGLFDKLGRPAGSTAQARGRIRAPIRHTRRPCCLPTGDGAAAKRTERIKDRRGLALANFLPRTWPGGRLEAFSNAEIAALSVIGLIWIARGFCAASLAELARRSFTSASTVRAAIDKAAALGLLVSIEDRRGRDGRSLTNRIEIVSSVWRDWLLRRCRWGSKNSHPQDNRRKKEGPKAVTVLAPAWQTILDEAIAGRKRNQEARTPPS